MNTLLAHRVDGILLSCADSFTPWERLERRKVPFVFFDRLPVGFKGAAVALDNAAAAAEATRFLIGLGHRRIAIIAGSQNVSPGIVRLEGFRQAMMPRILPYANSMSASEIFPSTAATAPPWN